MKETAKPKTANIVPESVPFFNKDGVHDSHTVEPLPFFPGSRVQREGESRVTVSSPVVDETLSQARQVHSTISGRGLYHREIELARSVFGNSIDYTAVRLLLTGAAPGNAASNNIALPPDFSIRNEEHRQMFIHEMAHVWQFQHQGPAYISTSLLQQLHAAISRGNRNFAYDYDIRSSESFSRFQPEQQAFIVENYYAVRRDERTLATPAGDTQNYHSNHLDAAGFPAVISAARRRAEIGSELPLHEAMIRQLRSAIFFSASELQAARYRNLVIRSLTGLESRTNRDLAPLETPALVTITF